jgi:hypothetical protein
MFELSDIKWKLLRSQFVTLENGRGKYTKYLPYGFTEQGVAMLSSVLKSKKALYVNIGIMRVFVEVRKAVLHNQEIINQLAELKL